MTPYLVVVGPETDAYSVNTPFEPTRGADIRHITDGTSGTILVLETDTPVPWTKPDDSALDQRLASPARGKRMPAVQTSSSPTVSLDSSKPPSNPIGSKRFLR